MNELNPLEKQLESWIPRRPSAKLKERLFSKSAQTEIVTQTPMPIMAWLLPATCVLLLVLRLNPPQAGHNLDLAYVGQSNLLGNLSSNLLVYSAKQPVADQQNIWSTVTFEWTNGDGSPSTMGSFPVGKTNVQKL